MARLPSYTSMDKGMECSIPQISATKLVSGIESQDPLKHVADVSVDDAGICWVFRSSWRVLWFWTSLVDRILWSFHRAETRRQHRRDVHLPPQVRNFVQLEGSRRRSTECLRGAYKSACGANFPYFQVTRYSSQCDQRNIESVMAMGPSPTSGSQSVTFFKRVKHVALHRCVCNLPQLASSWPWPCAPAKLKLLATPEVFIAFCFFGWIQIRWLWICILIWTFCNEKNEPWWPQRWTMRRLIYTYAIYNYIINHCIYLCNFAPIQVSMGFHSTKVWCLSVFLGFGADLLLLVRWCSALQCCTMLT